MLTVTERVANGVRLLDEKLPGWEKRVNLTTLEISSCKKCVLGQVFGYFSTGILSTTVLAANHGFGCCESLGDGPFSQFHPRREAAFAALTAEWKRVILERRDPVREIAVPMESEA